MQLLALAALGIGLGLVTVPPFGRPPRTHAEPALRTPRPAAKAPLVLPKPAPGDEEARAVTKLAAKGLGIRSGGGRRRWVALTFDDGPGPYTGQLLAVLESLEAPATFFQVGRMLQQFPAAGKLTGETPGMSIGDHTYSHTSMPTLGRDGQKQEILEAATLMQQQGEQAPRLFRPPYGAWDVHTRALTRRRGMAIVLWNVDSEDYTRPGVKRIVDNVVSAVKPGSIVLMHDAGGDRRQTLEAVPLIVKKLRRMGYGLVTVDKLLAGDPPRRKDDVGQPRAIAGVAG